jgi:hypothetical protein
VLVDEREPLDERGRDAMAFDAGDTEPRSWYSV